MGLKSELTTVSDATEKWGVTSSAFKISTTNSAREEPLNSVAHG